VDRKSSRLIMSLALGGILVVVAIAWLVTAFA
jgi:hypothetical protein